MASSQPSGAPSTIFAPVERPPATLGRFAAKTAIVAAAVTISVWIIAGQIFDRIDDLVDRATEQLQAMRSGFGGRDFWKRLEIELEKAADPQNDMPPEKRDKLLAELRVVVARWRPFVSEAAVLFSDKPPHEAPAEHR
jgi:hypothetical protein